MSEAHQVRDGRSKNWFYLDNELIDTFGGDSKDNPGIGVYAIAVYTVLARRSNDEHKCWPSYSSIATNLNVSRNTVIRAIATLDKAGLISIEQRVSHEQGKPTTTNIYTLLNIKTPSASQGIASAQESIGGASQGIEVVQEGVYPSAPQGPKEDSWNNTNKNNTKEKESEVLTPSPEKRVKAKGPKPPKELDPTANHPVIIIFRDAFKNTPSKEAREAMIEAVKDMALWERTVKKLKLNGKNPKYTFDFIEEYEKQVQFRAKPPGTTRYVATGTDDFTRLHPEYPDASKFDIDERLWLH